MLDESNGKRRSGGVHHLDHTFPLYRRSPAFKVKDDGFTHEIQSSTFTRRLAKSCLRGEGISMALLLLNRAIISLFEKCIYTVPPNFIE